MRKKLKNRLYTKNLGVFSFYPTRLLRQKKSKWVKIKKNILLSKKAFFFVNAYMTKKSLKSWDRFRLLYKLQLNAKRFVSKLYDDSFCLKKRSRTLFLLKEKRVLSLYAAPVYRLDIMLWFLLFTISPFSSRELIKKGLIFLNGVKLKNTVNLSKGDYIEIKHNFNQSYLENRLKYSVNKKILSFVEVDYYNHSFYCLKDLFSLEKEDVYILSTDYVDIQKF
jgi:ribosomal protein S4